jgi:hypothetical protein
MVVGSSEWFSIYLSTIVGKTRLVGEAQGGITLKRHQIGLTHEPTADIRRRIFPLYLVWRLCHGMSKPLRLSRPQ